MEPVFIDVHIHTSNNPDRLNESYDLDILKARIEEIADGADYLISLTDHNTINKPVYLKAVQTIKHILLGAELHVRNYENADPYHCHILFNLNNIDSATIDRINSKLDKLYPKKVVSGNDKIPYIQDIMNGFDEYEFVLLPHGGQNHSTFDRSIPDGVRFDRTLERNIYYNLIDGFTARSNKSLGKTHRYFEKLGIKDFVNLVTATDNYDPRDYPGCKAGRGASEFVPTWMLALPTFNGLRLSLSESSRLQYGKKPGSWAEYIQRVELQNEHTDINVFLTPGLNVVIGGSSSGKSLLVDSVYRRIIGDFSESIYAGTPYGIQGIEVTNPSRQQPHYLDQNYISNICDPKNIEYNIEDISILKSLFPSDAEERQAISNGLSELSSQLGRMVQSVREIQTLQDILKRIPALSHLIVSDVIEGNPLNYILPDDATIEAIRYSGPQYKQHIQRLDEIDRFLSDDPLVSHDKTLIERLKAELTLAYENARTESSIRDIILSCKKEIDLAQQADDREMTTKRQQFEQLRQAIGRYIRQERIFKESLETISKFKIRITTKEIDSMGHKLYIDNEFELTKEKFVEVVRGLLKSEHDIQTFDEIRPEALFDTRFRKKSPKVADYDDFEKRVKEKFAGMNRKRYRITTREGKDFGDLSPGWKTSVVLDLILGCSNDNAPLIIDQPEDNLATGYINRGLLEAIKKCKTAKQVILVSHNATIPMLGDAQNVVMCKNENNRIKIRSNPLEGSIDGVDVVDLIAETTDGGKASVKKRVKKYNLKRFRGPDETSV